MNNIFIVDPHGIAKSHTKEYRQREIVRECVTGRLLLSPWVAASRS